MSIGQALRRSATPLYAQIADVMRQRIRRRVWLAKQRLPSLEGLAAEFGVARLTVKQAMDVIAKEGLVARERGRGTFVCEVPADDRWLRLQTSLDTFWSMYVGTQVRLIRESEAEPLLEPGDGRAAARYRCMRRVNSRDGVPFSVASVYVDNEIFETEPDRFRTETVVSILLESPRITVARARQLLVIGTADIETADLLSVPVNSATAEVRRIFTDERGVAIYYAEVTYRADFVRLEMDLTRTFPASRTRGAADA